MRNSGATTIPPAIEFMASCLFEFRTFYFDVERILSEAIEVLIVEDNPADTYLIREAMHSEEPACKTTAIADGDTAIKYLSEQRPDIVVLDLNIPRRDGVEVLHFIRAENRLEGVVVIIFSSSPKDAIERKAPQADAHIQKPFDLDVFLQVGAKIMDTFRESQRRSS